MSISLIALRLEVAEDYPLLPHLHFSATRQKRVMPLSDTNHTKGEGSKEETPPVEEAQKVFPVDKCRGSRKLQEMTVETLSNCSAAENSSKPDVISEKKLNPSEPENESKQIKVTPEGKPLKLKPCDKKAQQNASKKNLKSNSLIKDKQGSKVKDSSLIASKGNEMSPTVCNTAKPEEKSEITNVNVTVEEDKDKDPNDGDDGENAINAERRNRLMHSPPIHFSSGNHFVDVTKGLLHLYKENQRTTLAEEAERSEMLCILAVPAAMTTHDLLQFVAPVYDDIEHMRIIRENKPNQYMVLVKFRNQLSADIFYKNFNGERFNSIEPEVCHLAFVAKVETVKESEEAYVPLPGHTELPTCPVCLERMDESVEGILTILCNHSFHGSCLAKWGDTSCPVCRYCQTPEVMPDNSCVECGSKDSLWICLICGHIGCGRYVDGHAYHHFLDTQHTYAMQLGNSRVWDYAGDNYVHRLVQNKADGKPVELEPRWMENEEKMDSMQLEYTYLLTSQLEAQRHYFEDRITRFETEALKQLEEMKEKTKHAVDERKQLEEKLNRVTREKQGQEKKIAQVSAKLNKIMLELKDEKEMNKCLRQNQALWQQKLNIAEKALKEIRDVKDKEILDLQEQVRDLMFYFDAKDKLQDVPNVSSQEIQEGQIVIEEASGISTEAAKPRKKKHR
ncbi:BRCA1-associated protein-like [Uloborus diversus]|uniref:BRCA1-associated protein-like n=1 Tax=Uloborus diversus TaxID=327109 RepID=UPI00240998C5|nr:BRCA1-associated protein-like [Uloborus diversus]